MFESPATPGQPDSDYNDPSKKSSQDALHTGLLVYNMNTCDGFTSGAYVWTGTKWEQMYSANDATARPAITVSVTGDSPCLKSEWNATTGTLLVHIPSGYDMRTLQNPFYIKVDWTPAIVLLNKATSTDDLQIRQDNDNTNDDRYARGGVVFSSNPPAAWMGSSGGTATYTFGVEAMDGLNIGYKEDDTGWYEYPVGSGVWIQNTPWRSRQTTLEFTTTKDICEQSDTLKVILNQTNSHLWVNRTDYKGPDQLFMREKNGLVYFRFLVQPLAEYEHILPSGGWDGNFFKFSTESNSWWKTEIDKYTDYSDIISDIRLPDGQRHYGLNWGEGEYLKGEIPKKEAFEPQRTGVITPGYDWTNPGSYPGFGYTSIPDRQSRTAARITFRDDWDCVRYPNVVYDIVQCSAKYDMTNIENGDDSSPSTWGDKILSHTDQNNNVFYSAMFGTDRWMTTNLNATTYADGTPFINGVDDSQGSLAPLVANELNIFDETVGPRYTYPLAGSANTNYEWGNKPVAPNDKQGYAGYYDKWYPEHGTLYNWFAAARQPKDGQQHPYNEGQSTSLDSAPGPTEVESTPDGYVQGICPNGWHLPSDREWNRLERHVYNQIRNKQFDQTQYDDDDKLKVQADIDAGIYPEWNPSGASEDWETTNTYLVRGYDVSEGSGYTGTYNPGHIGHGGALKSVCPPINLKQAWMPSSKGYSAEPKLGGFNAIPTGRMVGGSKISEVSQFSEDYPQGSMTLEEWVALYVSQDTENRSADDWNVVFGDYGYDSPFWTSSASGPSTAWIRNLTRNNTLVGKESFYMAYLVSVRCVKNK